ncbi:MAG: nucleotidyltransferase family protein, partial [Candidatus Rokubacteria bacterium]|nr:nucleotidyltransferase family protein [Candidatus Rokubacteria bacterium]
MRTPAVHRFLLGVLREPDPGAPGARPAADWEVVVRDAIAQGVAPFLYRWLKLAGAAGELPQELAARLERECFAVAARNMLLA